MSGYSKTNYLNKPGTYPATLKGLLLFYTLIFVFTGNTYGQPNSVIIDTHSLYKHGTNASGTSTYENIDSVSLGSTTSYFYMPDTGTNAGFDKTYTNLWDNVTDTYTWTVTPALAPSNAVSIATHSTATHYRQITWSGSTGTGSIEVKIKTPANCENTYTASVEVIPLPIVQFVISDSSFCLPNGSEGSLGYSLTGIRVSFSSAVKGNKALKVNITVVCTNSGFGALKTYNDMSITQKGSGTGTFDIPVNLNYLGLYTITLTAINDRISTKCGINGMVGATSAYNFVLSKVPAANPLYHLKNE